MHRKRAGWPLCSEQEEMLADLPAAHRKRLTCLRHYREQEEMLAGLPAALDPGLDWLVSLLRMRALGFARHYCVSYQSLFFFC